MSASLGVALGAVLVASFLQSATGFGFALIVAPALYSVLDAAGAVSIILLLGIAVSVLILGLENRRPVIDRRAVAAAVLFALPGLPLGALIVRVVPKPWLVVGVGAVVCALVVGRLIRRPASETTRARSALSGPVTGFVTGLLTTSTTTNGPPLALWLTARGLSPAEIRDTVTAIFLGLDVAGLGALVIVVGADASFTELEWLPALLPAAAVGQLAGRRQFHRIPHHRYEAIVLTIAVTAAVAGIVHTVA